MPAAEKLCSKCKTVKPASSFAARKDRAGGLYSCCKQCKSSYRSAKYRSDREKDPVRLWIKHAHSWAQTRAKNGSLDFELTRDDLATALTDNCVYCGVEFNFRRTIQTRSDSPTVDRIVPGLGYVKENIVTCCHRCNAIKNDATPARLLQIANTVLSLIEDRGLS